MENVSKELKRAFKIASLDAEKKALQAERVELPADMTKHISELHQRIALIDVTDEGLKPFAFGLEKYTAWLEQDYKSGQIESAKMYLIKICENLENLNSDESMIKRSKTELKRTIGLTTHNENLAATKAAIQVIATEFWNKDLDNEIRVSDMRDLAYAELYTRDEQLYKYLPEKAAVKDWVKEVAPEYAQKGGRPKKAKK